MMDDKASFKILLVEDNKADAVLVEETINFIPQEVSLTICTDGEKAIELLNKTDSSKIKPDLVLLDINLPKINGFEVLSSLRLNKIYRDLPIIIFTSSRYEEDVYLCYQLGANAVIYKPLDISEYTPIFKSLIDFWAEKRK